QRGQRRRTRNDHDGRRDRPTTGRAQRSRYDLAASRETGTAMGVTRRTSTSPREVATARIRLGLASSLTILAMAALAGCTSSPARPPPAGRTITPARPGIAVRTLPGKILFTRAGGLFKDGTLFTASVDGSHQLRISGFGAVTGPRWSPDGSHILLAA